MWSWVKRWFDPITTSKIFVIAEHNVYKTLSDFIEPANIPKKYGGELDFIFGLPPVLDPAEEKHVVWESTEQVRPAGKWPAGPLRWTTGENGTMVITAVGSIDGKLRREKVATFYPEGKVPFGSCRKTKSQAQEAMEKSLSKSDGLKGSNSQAAMIDLDAAQGLEHREPEVLKAQPDISISLLEQIQKDNCSMEAATPLGANQPNDRQTAFLPSGVAVDGMLANGQIRSGVGNAMFETRVPGV